MNPSGPEFKIGRRKFKLVRPERPRDPLLGHTRLPYSGPGVIRVNKDSNKRREASTLFHELLHAFSFAYRFSLSERQVRNVERAFADFCRRHPREARRLVRELSR